MLRTPVRILNRHSGLYQSVTLLAWPLHDAADGEDLWLGSVVDPRLAGASRRKDEFLAVLAHELRNPLAPIKNWVTVLRDGPADPMRQKEALEVIDRQLDRLTHLVDDLFDAARISEGKLRIRTERFELEPAIAAAVQVVEHEVATRGPGCGSTFRPSRSSSKRIRVASSRSSSTCSGMPRATPRAAARSRWSRDARGASWS